jgi:hypothetical protein
MSSTSMVVRCRRISDGVYNVVELDAVLVRNNRGQAGICMLKSR